MPDSPAPAALFDSIGTLFDLGAPRTALIRLGAPAHAVEFWMAEAMRDAFAASLANEYRPLHALLAASLGRSLGEYGLDITSDQRDAVLETLGALGPADGAYECCHELARDGWRLWCVTNGAERAAHELLERAGMRADFAGVLSADGVRRFRPHPEVYRVAAGRAGEGAWMVTAHAWDVVGAQAFGLHAVWVRQLEREWPVVFPSPEAVAPRMQEVPAVLRRHARVA